MSTKRAVVLLAIGLTFIGLAWLANRSTNAITFTPDELRKLEFLRWRVLTRREDD